MLALVCVVLTQPAALRAFACAMTHKSHALVLVMQILALQQKQQLFLNARTGPLR
jgi:hypothetical protein